jgi:glycosyltransferase involved in cell wall biosynthesis
MSRVLVVGYGVSGITDPARSMGPGRRAIQFASGVAEAGHETHLLWLSPRASVSREWTMARRDDGTFVERYLDAAMLVGERGRAFVEWLGVDAIVGATVHASSYVAKEMVGDLPLWTDVFGDPMAEAQAKAAADGNDLAVARYWTTLLPALERGDRFSAVSATQAASLLGQLGIAGRLTGATAGQELVSVIPCAAMCARADSAPPVASTRWPAGAFVVLFSGSFNTWCDIPTMVAGVEVAMDEDATIHWAVTGGPVPGHDERTYREFRSRVDTSRHRSRIHVLGWVDAPELARVYATVDCGINVERDLYERRLGAENRIVEWMAHGVPAVSTGLSEPGRLGVDQGLAFRVTPGDARDLARVIVDLSGHRDRVRHAGSRCRDYVSERLSVRRTTEPLVAWCRRPHRTASRRDRGFRLALASDPRSLTGLLEDYLADLGPGEIAYRSVRWFWRRLRRGRGPARVDV